MTLLDGHVTATEDLSIHRPSRHLPLVPRAMRVHLTHPAERIGWALASVLLVTLGAQAWAGSNLLPGSAYLGIVLIPVAFACFIRCLTHPDGPTSRLQLVVMIAFTLSVADIAALTILAQPFYGTDAVAFGQYSAGLVLHGHNPFTASMLPSLTEFRVPVIYHTHFLDGRPMLEASYPAGSFLPYVPFLAMGWHTQMAVAVDIAFWIVAMFLMWRLLPNNLRFIVPVLMSIPQYLGMAIGGVNDTLYLPFVILALWRWDRYADQTERSPARWIGPIAMGLAATVKPTPWFLIPFLVVGVAIESRRDTGRIQWLMPIRYCAIVGGIFFAVNAPWIIADPAAWFKGSVAPLAYSFIPMGQGLVNLTLAQRLGGGNLTLFTLSGALWVVLTLLALMLRYRQMKRVWPAMLLASFFFTPRSLGNYLMMLLPAAIVAGMTVRSTTPNDLLTAAPAAYIDGEPRYPVLRRSLRSRLAMPVLAIVCLSSLAAGILALVTPSPVAIKIQGTRTNGQKASVTDVTVSVTNKTGSVQTPHFTVNRNGFITNFWYPVNSATGDNSLTLAPHAIQTVTLHAPDIASMPGTSEPFQVYAYTAKPATISSSDPYYSSTTSVTLAPMAVDTPVRVGDSVTFTAQLTDRLGRDVHKAGVRLSFGQVIYAPVALLGGETSIDGMPEGKSPGFATTDANGVAHFTVVGKHARQDPTYFQAWMTGDQGLPSGYSNIVTVQFTGK